MHEESHSDATAKISIERLPDLPIPIKNGIGVQIGNQAYIGLGTAGTIFLKCRLDIPSTGWKRCADFIGPQTFGAVAAGSGGKIYVFGGNGHASSEAKSATIFETCYVYDPALDQWEVLSTTTPCGLSGAQALPLEDGRIAIIGGYNKRQFDEYLAALNSVDKDNEPEAHAKLVIDYMSKQPNQYEWNSQVHCYCPRTNQWTILGDNPYLPNCDANALKTDKDSFIIIGGEIKPGLRTSMIKTIEIEDNGCHWKRLADLPPSSGNESQEGLAGAYAARLDDKIVLAGGVNFNGAKHNFSSGKAYAHQGLRKQWHLDVYLYEDQSWQVIGKLPVGLGYGASFQHDSKLFIAGGEDMHGNAQTIFLALAVDEQ